MDTSVRHATIIALSMMQLPKFVSIGIFPHFSSIFRSTCCLPSLNCEFALLCPSCLLYSNRGNCTRRSSEEGGGKKGSLVGPETGGRVNWWTFSQMEEGAEQRNTHNHCRFRRLSLRLRCLVQDIVSRRKHGTQETSPLKQTCLLRGILFIVTIFI